MKPVGVMRVEIIVLVVVVVFSWFGPISSSLVKLLLDIGKGERQASANRVERSWTTGE